MKHKFKIILPLLLLFALSACKKALDIEPIDSLPNEEAITTPADLKNLVEAVYDGMQSGLALGGNRVVYADFFADDANVIESNLSPFGTLEMYNRTMTSQINDLRNMWRDCYSSINRANNVLRVIESGSLESHINYNPSDFAVYKATALFARATLHFEMVRFWGLPYDCDNIGGNSQAGIPYRKMPTLSGPDGLAMARNSVEEVYTYAIEDLEAALSAIDSLGDGTDIYDSYKRDRIDPWAIKAYLAKIKFFMGKYTEAAQYADEVINSGLFTLSAVPRACFTQNSANNVNEQIFQLVSVAEDRSGNPAWAYSRFGFPLMRPLASAMSQFHSNDTRLNNSNGYFYVSFFGDSTIAKYDLPNAVNGINMCVLRLAEMYLIVAESNLLAGGNGDVARAIDLYSELYELRSGTAPTIPSDQAQLLEDIRLERRLELMFEGDRLHNLKRMKQALRNGIPYNDPSVLFKIPQEEMSGNSLMQQNP
jgi:hypothetical protein